MDVWYGPDEIRTLDQGSSWHLSGADGAWHTARMLAGGAWVHWLDASLKVHVACTGCETRPEGTQVRQQG